MKTIVLDTNVLIDNVHGFAKWIDILFKNPQEYILVVPTIVVAEYLTAQEVETEVGYKVSKKYLSAFKIGDFTLEAAEILGRILRRKTYVAQASLADLIIASTTIHLKGELATKNKSDFKDIPNLRFFTLS